MLFLSFEDFQRQAKTIPPLSREEEQNLAQRMAAGDPQAREELLRGYLPLISAVTGRMPREYQTLELVMGCCAALERAAQGFDFTQNSEAFSHRLNRALRQTTVGYLADRRSGDI